MSEYLQDDQKYSPLEQFLKMLKIAEDTQTVISPDNPKISWKFPSVGVIWISDMEVILEDEESLLNILFSKLPNVSNFLINFKILIFFFSVFNLKMQCMIACVKCQLLELTIGFFTSNLQIQCKSLICFH